MKLLKLDATEDTPFVFFDAQNGIFDISKRSLPENAIVFYEQLLIFINEYKSLPALETKVNFHFDYLNTSSIKQIMKVILLFDQLATSTKVFVTWCYDVGDTDMFQTGQRFEKLTSLSFNYKEI